MSTLKMSVIGKHFYKNMYNPTELSIIRSIKKGLPINWAQESWDYKLSEKFIREFSNKVSWWAICAFQKLSEPFIEEFSNRVSWSDISYDTKFSRKFIIKFLDKLHLHQIPLCRLNIKNEHSWKTFL